MADRRNQNLLCLPDLSVGQAHKDSLRKIAVFFSENVDPAYMVGFLFHFHPQSDIGMRRQVQRFQSDFRIDGKTVQVTAVPFYRKCFQKTVLGSAVAPGGRSQAAPAASEISGLL